ncbi:hypothetical protein FE697_008840 [Mumia zhuanghuii]|uniref:Uncharacterized protein n=2 Tax=Mumia TaxID=1546255 RepID=A0ABW1QLN0_9ACTN|nr:MULTISPECIES: hypothetical protein [Mumia]KAA1423676.1 hypothetical protein FE697_008840 [Mumia zhuanghuii]
MDAATTITAGVVVLTVITIETGGAFMLRVVGGRQPANALQTSFFRAGHAHAGVLVILGLVTLLLTSSAGVDEPWAMIGPLGVLVAAIVMPAGFFLSVLGSDPQRPGRLIVLVYAGAVLLAAGLATTGISLVVTGATA